MTYLSHTASFHSNERIAPSDRGIKHLGGEPEFGVYLVETFGRRSTRHGFSPIWKRFLAEFGRGRSLDVATQWLMSPLPRGGKALGLADVFGRYRR
jgi:hypothetical protein